MGRSFDEQEISVPVPGGEKRLLMRLPRTSARRPGLLLSLALDRRSTIEDLPFCTASDVLLENGYAVATLDLPCHGDEPDRVTFGGGIEGFAAAMRRGINPFTAFAATTKAVLSECVARGFNHNGPIVMAGTSRGGLCALHVAAADRSVVGLALYSPVTRLEVLKEFHDCGDLPIVAANDAVALATALSRCRIWLGINTDDPRVRTACADEFIAALRTAGAEHVAAIHVPGSTHRLSAEAYVQGAEFLLEILAEMQST
jgi:dienelactone hydrolase